MRYEREHWYRREGWAYRFRYVEATVRMWTEKHAYRLWHRIGNRYDWWPGPSDYLQVGGGEIHRTVQVSDNVPILVDVDAGGQPIGIEFVDGLPTPGETLCTAEEAVDGKGWHEVWFEHFEDMRCPLCKAAL